MNLNDLLQGQKIDPKNVLVLRHRPHERELREVLPWLAAEKPKVFNAYQQTQGPKLERAMEALVGSGFVASFIGHEPGKAIFVGLYSIVGAKPLTYDEYWKVPEYIEMKKYAMQGWCRETDDRQRQFWFDLQRTDFYSSWQGKLIVGWPPPERSWWRRAHRNEISVHAILEDTALTDMMPKWNEANFTWQQLGILPKKWREELSRWRGIYFIFDQNDGKGYVGAAYGEDNLFGRWLNYAKSGDGDNKKLKGRNPENFRFSILQILPHDMEPEKVQHVEKTWKDRLHTREYGLNDN